MSLIDTFKIFIADFPQNFLSLIVGDYKYILKKAGPILPIGMYMVDEEGYFVYCNDVCKNILGVPSDEDIRRLN
ncbi:hypothetical protein B6D60_09230, partial [candidate division KSB1 bacterium 4484_87]